MTPRSVLLADDHTVLLDGLRAILAVADDIEVVAEARTGREAVEGAATASPDVVVMDLGMPDVNGIEATRRIVAGNPNVAVLVLSMYEDDASLFAALRAGARGYLLKGSRGREVVEAI